MPAEELRAGLPGLRLMTAAGRSCLTDRDPNMAAPPETWHWEVSQI